MCNFYHFYSSRIYILEFLVLRIECLLIYIQCCIHTNLSVTDTLSYFLSQDAGLTISTASASGYGIWDIQISAEIFISHNNFSFFLFSQQPQVFTYKNDGHRVKLFGVASKYSGKKIKFGPPPPGPLGGDF